MPVHRRSLFVTIVSLSDLWGIGLPLAPPFSFRSLGTPLFVRSLRVDPTSTANPVALACTSLCD